MTRRKLNKKKGFRGFKVIIDISVLKELDIYNKLNIINNNSNNNFFIKNHLCR